MLELFSRHAPPLLSLHVKPSFQTCHVSHSAKCLMQIGMLDRRCPSKNSESLAASAPSVLSGSFLFSGACLRINRVQFGSRVFMLSSESGLFSGCPSASKSTVHKLSPTIVRQHSTLCLRLHSDPMPTRQTSLCVGFSMLLLIASLSSHCWAVHP